MTFRKQIIDDFQFHEPGWESNSSVTGSSARDVPPFIMGWVVLVILFLSFLRAVL